MREPRKWSIGIQSYCRPGSVLPKGSSEPLTHRPDIDLHCYRSNCNPGKDKRYSTESVGASGTTRHRQIFLKRRGAYCHLVFWDYAGPTQLHPACTVRRMPQFWAKMLRPSVIPESRKWNFGGYYSNCQSYLGACDFRVEGCPEGVSRLCKPNQPASLQINLLWS
jgi:hypothetical protein